MEQKRRDFLKSLSLGGAVAAAGATSLVIVGSSDAHAGKKKPTSAVLNLCLQEGVAPGETLTEKLDFMEAHGFNGIEVWGDGLGKRISEFNNALRNRKIKFAVVCAGFKGNLINNDPAIRQQAMDSIKEIMAAGGELGALGMVIVPSFNNQPSLVAKDARDLLLEQLKELGEWGVKHKTSVILEPLNRQEAYFLRQVADAAAICKDVNSEGVKCMGDFWHMTFEETSDMAAFISAGDYLQHVHIASRKRRKTPSEDGAADVYTDGFKGLKLINYNKYISFECGSIGDKKVTIPAAVKLIKEQWSKA